jgi:ABC-type transporter Mla MlaB component
MSPTLMSLLKKRLKSDEVEFATPTVDGSHFYLDGAPFSALFSSISFIIFLGILHFLIALKSPSLLDSKTEFFSLNATDKTPVDVDIRLNSLLPLHRWISLSGSISTLSPSFTHQIPINFTVSRTLLSAYHVISETAAESRSDFLNFTTASRNSTTFSITESAVNSADEIRVFLTLSANFSNINGLNVIWQFCNPGALQFSQSAQLLLAFMMTDILAIYIFNLRFDSEIWTQIFLLILGAAGIFGSNPFSYFSSISNWIDEMDFVLPSGFIAIFRTFVWLQLHILGAKTTSAGLVRTFLTVLVFGIYAGIDANVAIERRIRLVASLSIEHFVLKLEWILMGFDFVYIIASIGMLVFATIGSEGANFRRLVLFALSLLVTNGITFCSHFWLLHWNKSQLSVLPQILYLSGHVIVVAALLFLLRSEEIQQYQVIGEVDVAEVLDIDSGSMSVNGDFQEGFAEFAND